MTTPPNTVLGTEENLRLEVDPHPLGPRSHRTLEPSSPHDVLVDGLRGKASVGCHGGYSERIVVTLEEDHPEIGRSFSTKSFLFLEPGRVGWGHEGRSFGILKIIN